MLSVVDNVVIVLCIVGIFAIGYHFSRTSQDMDSFYKANRALPWSLVVGTLMASWYGGAGVIGCLSIAEIAAVGYVGEAAWNADKLLVSIIVVVVSIAITCLGGLMGVAVTDMIFFFLMVASVSAIFPKIFFDIGGIEGIFLGLKDAAPEMLTPLGGIPAAQAVVLIVLCINIYKDPAFYQRFAAANSPKTGKRALLLCFSIWLSFDVVAILTAMIIRVNDPGLLLQPEVSYVRMILSHLPVVLRGLFVVGLMGAIVSTLDSYYLIGGEIISNDIIYMLRGDKPLSDKLSIRVARISSVVFGAIGLFAAFRFAMVYDAFLFLSSISMTLLFVPMIAALMYKGEKNNSGRRGKYGGWCGDLDSLSVYLPY